MAFEQFTGSEEFGEICGYQSPAAASLPESARIIYAPADELVWSLIRGKLLELLDAENYDTDAPETAAIIAALKPSILKSCLEDVPVMTPQVFENYAWFPASALINPVTLASGAFLATSGQVLDALWIWTVSGADIHELQFVVAEGDYVVRFYGAQSTTSFRATWTIDDQSYIADQSWNGAAALNTIKTGPTVTLSSGLHTLKLARNPASSVSWTQLRLSMIEILSQNPQGGGGT